MSALNLKDYVTDVPDFPKPGIIFRDISPLLADKAAWRHTIERFAEYIAKEKPDLILGLESRGFLLQGALAFRINAGHMMARKKGKLPGRILQADYGLEYREADTLEIQDGLIKPGQRVAVVDDVLATGGTAEAAVDLVRRAGGEVTSVSVIIELAALKGRQRLDVPVNSLLQYD